MRFLRRRYGSEVPDDAHAPHAGSQSAIPRAKKVLKPDDGAACSRATSTRQYRSVVGELVEPHAALQRQTAHGSLSVDLTMPREARTFDQERRSGFHPVAGQAEALVIKIQECVLIRDTARSRQDGDAIGSRRIQHGFHFRCPRKR